MSLVLAKLTRWMPVFFAIAALLSVVQLAMLVASFAGRATRSPRLAAHGVLLAEFLGTLAGVGVALILLSVARAARRLPAGVTKWS